jgi:hypothetical protein
VTPYIEVMVQYLMGNRKHRANVPLQNKTQENKAEML